MALVKAERKRAAALDNVAEMEEDRKKLAEAEQARRLLLFKTVVNTKFPS